MTHVLKVLVVLAVLLGLASMAAGAELQGVLLDKMCAAKLAKSGTKAVQAHTKECALMPDCMKSGYAIYTGGKLISLDEEGNKQAVAALQASKKTANLRVRISGEQTGDTIKVKTLKLL